ncbi:MAG TPA: SRPBCC domain-containing protein [Mycobacteriales bacterium]|jgi:uncharacterized protein YndB with AHSA1/START domain|nr:SRPBCC domain-containing protein [Mycobacteriales bacterium]
MPIVSTDKNAEALSLTVVAEYAAPPERVWQLWVDARQIEQWWGPPYWPATFEKHDVTVGGESRYYLSGPDGEKPRAWWRFVTVEEPTLLEFEHGFSDESGTPNHDMPPTHGRVEIAVVDGRTRMTATTRFASVEQMEHMLTMGMAEGTVAAIGQIDELLTR